MSQRLRITRGAREDIKRILRRSEQDFGPTIRGRYRRLIDAALLAVAEAPDRVGVRRIDEVRAGHYVYHLWWSRKAVSGTPIRRPRHLIVFSVQAATVTIAAVVHERELLDRHLSK